MDRVLFQPFPMLPGRRAQLWRHQPSYWRPPHFHHETELNLVLRGSCVMRVGERRHVLQSGSLLFLAPGQPHEMLSASSDLSLWVMALAPELAERAFGEPKSLAVNQTGLSEQELETRLFKISQLHDSVSVEQELSGVFQNARSKLLLHAVPRRALQRMYEEPALSAQQLAAQLGTNPSVLSRLFHQQVGVSFVKHRSRVRILQFIRKVDQGAPLTTAAFASGFGSYAQLFRSFCRELGCSPSVFFEQMREPMSRELSPRLPATLVC